MPHPLVLNFHIAATKRAQAALGEGIFGKIVQAVEQAGWRVNLRDKDDPVGGVGYHIVYNQAVLEPNCLCLRRCYMNPFWRLETSNYRWEWQVASKTYPVGTGEDWFQKRWQSRVFADTPIRDEGHIFMPLQGKLLEHRHFQSQSPVDMIAETLKADPARNIVATLHPRETYSPRELDRLAQFGPRFTLTDRPSIDALASCAYVVTENSAMALSGFFANKPAVLFAEIDFHHIAGSVPMLGVKDAFAAAHAPKPFAHYLHWFFKKNALSVIDDNVVAHIQSRLRDHGWPI